MLHMALDTGIGGFHQSQINFHVHCASSCQGCSSLRSIMQIREESWGLLIIIKFYSIRNQISEERQ